MAFAVEINGHRVEFESKPSQNDIDEAVASNPMLGKAKTTRKTITEEDVRRGAATEFVNQKIGEREATPFFSPLQVPELPRFADPLQLTPKYNELSRKRNIPSPLNFLGAAIERPLAAITNPILERMQGGKDVLDPIIKGLTGERVGQPGDIFRQKFFGKVPTEALEVGAGASSLASEVALFGAYSKIGKFGAMGKAKIKPSEKIALSKLSAQEQSIAKAEKLRQRVDTATKLTQRNLKTLSDDMAKVTEKTVGQAKTKMSDFNKAFSKTYENALDDVANNVRGKITVQETGKWGDDLIAQLKANPDFAKTQAFKRLKSYVNKLKKSKKPIEFRKLNSDIKDIRMRKFGGETSVDDLVKDSIRHDFGDFVSKYDPSFQKMQAESGRIINMKKAANKVLKSNNEVDVGKIEKLLKKDALGKTSLQEKKLIEQIQGSIGKEFNAELRIVGKKIQLKQKGLSRIKEAGKEMKTKATVSQKLTDIEFRKNLIKAKATEATGQKGGLRKGAEFVGNVTIRALIYRTLFGGMFGGGG